MRGVHGLEGGFALGRDVPSWEHAQLGRGMHERGGRDLAGLLSDLKRGGEGKLGAYKEKF
jgi:hypothetical protein